MRAGRLGAEREGEFPGCAGRTVSASSYRSFLPRAGALASAGPAAGVPEDEGRGPAGRRPRNPARETRSASLSGPGQAKSDPPPSVGPEVLAFPGVPEQVAAVGGSRLYGSGAGDRGSALGWVGLSNW